MSFARCCSLSSGQMSFALHSNVTVQQALQQAGCCCCFAGLPPSTNSGWLSQELSRCGCCGCFCSISSLCQQYFSTSDTPQGIHPVSSHMHVRHPGSPSIQPEAAGTTRTPPGPATTTRCWEGSRTAAGAGTSGTSPAAGCCWPARAARTAVLYACTAATISSSR